MDFSYLFILFALVSVVIFVFGMRVRHRNFGFLFMILNLIIMNIITFMVLRVTGITGARVWLSLYYIWYAWLCLGLVLAVTFMSKPRFKVLYIIGGGLISIYQTVLMLGNFLGSPINSFEKHIFLGRNWWMATAAKNSTWNYSFDTYRVLAVIAMVYILAMLVVGFVKSSKLFRPKYIALMIAHVVYAVGAVIVIVLTAPEWIMCILMNLFAIVALYFMNYYTNNKLKSWSLTSFANEMSDGFILYDEYNDLIYTNSLIRNTLSQELLEDFEDKNKLEKWIRNVTTVENIEAVKYEHEGKYTYFKIKTIELNVHGSNLGTIYVLHDTTDSILQISAMELANEELERAARMKSDFLANMSHEIRTPMNAVIGMAEIALREQLPANVREYLTQIQHSGKNLLNIINDILDFSKIESGKMEIIPEEYDPLSELMDIANVLVTRIGDKPLELFIIEDSRIPHILEGDAMRIRQIIINLANNAIKFTKEGVVRVTVDCEPISEDEVMMTYHVIDTGMGIKEEDINKLFVSFQQVDSKRNRAVEGTGLGLAISKKLCEAMGGSVGVKSEYGVGSDFYFNIPQKVVDHERYLVVEEASEKYAFCLNDRPEMVSEFIAELDRFGVAAETISSMDDYHDTGKKEYLFFEKPRFDEVKGFLEEHKNITGVILVEFGDNDIPKLSNMLVMSRPETTYSMVSILNGKNVSFETEDDLAESVMDFIAPTANMLIVDDNAINITIAQGLLDPIKSHCDSALSGKEAIEKIQNNKYDIVFMDHMMPEMDGIETVKRIRSEMPELADMPIIALTANAMEGAKEMFLSAGMNDIVTKPIDFRIMLSKLKQWLPEEKVEKIDPSTVQMESAEGVSYEGLDSEKAIENLGSASLYNKVVEEYYRSGTDKYEGISLAYGNHDWNDYTIRVHALKSSSRQIGAYELGDMAEALEKAGNSIATAFIYEKTSELLDTYSSLLQTLSQYFPDEQTDDSLPPIEKDHLAYLMDVLKTACDDLDMDGMEEVRDEMKKFSYPEEQKAIVLDLYKAIDGMDVDECVNLADQLL